MPIAAFLHFRPDGGISAPTGEGLFFRAEIMYNILIPS